MCARKVAIKGATIMDDHKKYRIFRIVFGALLIVTIILIFSNKDRFESIIPGVLALVNGAIYLYFKFNERADKRREKDRKLHLDK